jgi:K(+)-stimulated pyrophosphate-energized sodium pump
MAFIGLAFMFTKWVLKQDPGDGKIKEISDYIYEGALASSKQNIVYNILCYEPVLF